MSSEFPFTSDSKLWIEESMKNKETTSLKSASGDIPWRHRTWTGVAPFCVALVLGKAPWIGRWIFRSVDLDEFWRCRDFWNTLFKGDGAKGFAPKWRDLKFVSYISRICQDRIRFYLMWFPCFTVCLCFVGFLFFFHVIPKVIIPPGRSLMISGSSPDSSQWYFFYQKVFCGERNDSLFGWGGWW